MKIYTRERAKNDLIEIWAYTFEKWGKEQADGYIDKIKAMYRTLCDHPNIGSKEDHAKAGMRRMLVRRHMIYYRIFETHIEIVRILHERMDADKQLDE